MQVRVIVGAQAAYACISHESGTLDVRLNPGRSARKSMKESAAELREKAAELTRRAALIENAAEPGRLVTHPGPDTAAATAPGHHHQRRSKSNAATQNDHLERQRVRSARHGRN